MQLCGVLVLFITMTTVCGLRCYTCTATDPRSCIDAKSCAVIFNRCFSIRVEGYDLVTKGCQTSALCVAPIDCCEGDLCNNTVLTGPSFIVLLVSLAVVTQFI
uniref:UPAR/Ly6 domain-containing protein n=1 Tax=Cynoglossus semilaevis TaxID=244447 RepID=A0A3P8WNU7_CYNSE